MLKKAGEQVESMLAGLGPTCRGGVGEGTSPGFIETWEYDSSKRLMTQRVGGYRSWDDDSVVSPLAYCVACILVTPVCPSFAREGLNQLLCT